MASHSTAPCSTRLHTSLGKSKERKEKKGKERKRKEERKKERKEKKGKEKKEGSKGLKEKKSNASLKMYLPFLRSCSAPVLFSGAERRLTPV